MKLTEEHKKWIVTYVTQQRTRAEQATRTFREQWQELWQAYQSKQDYTGKASWQSQAFIPKVWMKVERAAGEVKRAMLQAKRLFKFELIDDAEQAKIAELRTQRLDITDADELGRNAAQIEQVQRRIKARQEINAIQERRFKTALAETNFIASYAEMVKAAFLVSIGIAKVGWDDTEQRAVFKHVNALNFRIDPEWEASSDKPPKYMIEDYEQSLLDLQAEAEEINAALKASTPEAPAVYDVRAIKHLTEGTADLTKRQQEQQQKGLDHIESEKGTLQMWRFWGDIPTEKGDKWLLRDALVIIANGQECIRASRNPFDHGRPPYQVTIPIVYPHRGSAGSPLAGPVVKLNYTYNQLWNLLMDNLNFTVNKMVQGNPTHLREPKDRAVYPGKFWAHTLGPGQDAVSELALKPVGPDLIFALEIIRQDMEEGMSVTRTLEGQSPAHKEPLGTTQLKTGQAQGFFDVIAWDLENSSLRPLLEMTYDLYAQYAGFPPRQDNFRLQVGGISLMMQVEQMIERISSTLAAALKVPDLTQRTDINWLWQRLLDLQGLSDAFVDLHGGQDDLSAEQKDNIAGKAEAMARQDMSRMAAGESVPRLSAIAGAPR